MDAEKRNAIAVAERWAAEKGCREWRIESAAEVPDGAVEVVVAFRIGPPPGASAEPDVAAF